MKKRTWYNLIAILIFGIFFYGFILNGFGKVDLPIKETQQEMNDVSKTEITEFADGRWISEKDSLSGIQIENGKWTMFYNGHKTDSSDIFDYKVQSEYLTITNQSDTLEYSILEYSSEWMSLIYLPRGNTLNYKPEK